MNYKKLIKEIRETERACLIPAIDDKGVIKTTRANNEIKFLRFFFCGNFKPLVEKYKAIGFYVMIEKNYLFHDYDLRAFWITEREQQQGEDFFTERGIKSISEGYKNLLIKLKELLN